jgi:hypothetical protein
MELSDRDVSLPALVPGRIAAAARRALLMVTYFGQSRPGYLKPLNVRSSRNYKCERKS